MSMLVCTPSGLGAMGSIGDYVCWKQGGGSVMAVDAINRDPSILPHHHLRLTTANYSMTAPIASMMAAYSVVRHAASGSGGAAHIGASSAAYSLVRQRPVAVIGPHTSEQAALVSPFATATQVPFVSASATDAQLTVGGTRPFFMRTVQSDGHQMRAIAGGWVCALPFSLYLPPGESNGHLVQAIADILAIYQWKAFIAIHSDDRYGGNGITALEACVLALNQGISMAHRVAITPGSTAAEVQQRPAGAAGGGHCCVRFARIHCRCHGGYTCWCVCIHETPQEASHFTQQRLQQLCQRLQVLLEVDTAVCVLHTSTAVATAVILAANRLGLFSANNVWIATEGSALLAGSALHYAQGMIVTATNIPTSAPLTAFISKWLTLDPVRFPNVSRQMPMAYALASHDAVYLIAHALHSILYNSSSASRSNSVSLPSSHESLTSPTPSLTIPFPPPPIPTPPLHTLQAAMLRITFMGASGTISLSPWGCGFHAASSHAENDVRGRIRHHLPVPLGRPAEQPHSHPQHPPQSSLMLSPPDPAFYPPSLQWGPMLRAAMLRTTFEGASGTISLSPWGDQQSNLTRILNIHSQATDQSTQSTQSTKSPMDATSAVTGSVSLQGNVEVVPVGYWSPTRRLYQTTAASVRLMRV
ncbi:unnamed protein product [Closterium sp. Naga37s-1]|nr:unnamed protein product [Closterium sp. Naga37s-1]